MEDTKELVIRVRIKGKEILSILDTSGFTEGIVGKFEIIGILENLKSVELEKLKTTLSITNINHDEYKINKDKEDKNDKSFMIK